MPLPQLPQEVWMNIIVQLLYDVSTDQFPDYNHRNSVKIYPRQKTTLQEFLDMRRVNSVFEKEINYALFYRNIKYPEKRREGRHIPHKFLFLRLQGALLRKQSVDGTNQRAHQILLEAAGYDTSTEMDETCFLYPAGHICPRLQADRTSCLGHVVLNSLVYALGTEARWWGRATRTSGTPSPRDLNIYMAISTGKDARVRALLSDVQAEEIANHEDWSLETCLHVAVRTNQPSMIKTLMTESLKRHATMERFDDKYTKYGFGRAAEFCFVEAIEINHLEVFNVLLEHLHLARVPRSKHFTSKCCSKIFQSSPHLSPAEQDAFFQTLLRFSTDWDAPRDMITMLHHIGRADSQSAMEILFQAIRSIRQERCSAGDEYSLVNTSSQSEDISRDPKKPLSSIVSSGNLELVRLFLENWNCFLPDLEPKTYREMRQLVLIDELSSSSSHSRIAKLIVEHSRDMVDDKPALMSILQTPAIQAQKLEKWAWLAHKCDLDTFYQPAPLPSFGAVLLRDAVASLNADNVQFLLDEGVRLEHEVTTPLVWTDDEDAFEKVKRIRRLLDRVSQQAGTRPSRERQAFTVTFE